MDAAEQKELITQRFGKLMGQKTGMVFLDVSVMPGQVRILARQPPGRIGDFVAIVHRLLGGMETAGWKLDISKPYFLRDNRVVQAIRFIIQTQDPATHLEEIVSLVTDAPRAGYVEIDEIVLPGADPDRHSNKKGKGAVPNLKPRHQGGS